MINKKILMRKNLITLSFVIWIAFVYGFHYANYYGPRLLRFLQQWLTR
jgi:hypothetical protein